MITFSKQWFLFSPNSHHKQAMYLFVYSVAHAKTASSHLGLYKKSESVMQFSTIASHGMFLWEDSNSIPCTKQNIGLLNNLYQIFHWILSHGGSIVAVLGQVHSIAVILPPQLAEDHKLDKLDLIVTILNSLT